MFEQPTKLKLHTEGNKISLGESTEVGFWEGNVDKDLLVTGNIVVRARTRSGALALAEAPAAATPLLTLANTLWLTAGVTPCEQAGRTRANLIMKGNVSLSDAFGSVMSSDNTLAVKSRKQMELVSATAGISSSSALVRASSRISCCWRVRACGEVGGYVRRAGGRARACWQGTLLANWTLAAAAQNTQLRASKNFLASALDDMVLRSTNFAMRSTKDARLEAVQTVR